ncbi:hypothetical protein, partial [Stenotrophomonas muris]|uniref:hypothetical protein n=1 Tax=Stenotrophomonas muris TaxID=2963283 RepID=UPI0039C6ABB2
SSIEAQGAVYCAEVQIVRACNASGCLYRHPRLHPGRAWHMRRSPGRGKQGIAHVHPQGS